MRIFSVWNGLSPKSISLMKTLYELNVHQIRREIHLGHVYEMDRLKKGFVRKEDLLHTYEDSISTRIDVRLTYDRLAYPLYLNSMLEDMVLIKRYQMMVDC